jgi:hypothetical protein
LAAIPHNLLMSLLIRNCYVFSQGLPHDCGTGALGGSFADVSCAAANVAAGAALLRLGGRLGCVGRLRRGLGLAALAAGVLAADGKG